MSRVPYGAAKLCRQAEHSPWLAAGSLQWLKREINDAWERREEITPSYEGAPKPGVLKILMLLPRRNCHECGQPTCMVFSAKIAEGAKGQEYCMPLKEDMRVKPEKYMSDFVRGFPR
jgi:ArsR family metal-binding transcriptional regulator